MIWKIHDRVLSLNRIFLLGVLNLTPDSFSDGGAYFEPAKAMEQAAKLVEEGADILDVGAESSRPGADTLSEDEELSRLRPVLKGLLRRFNIPISIDTTKPAVALACLREGAHIINDVSGLRTSGVEMAKAIGSYKPGLILMHRRGDAKTMGQFAQYQNVTQEVMSELEESFEIAIREGIAREQIVLDPGLGFSKTTGHNIQILRELEKFRAFKRPVLIGPSRKKFLGEITGRPVNERDFATAGCAAAAVLKGVHLVRVHEVRAIRDAIRVAEAIRGDNHVGAF